MGRMKTGLERSRKLTDRRVQIDESNEIRKLTLRYSNDDARDKRLAEIAEEHVLAIMNALDELMVDNGKPCPECGKLVFSLDRSRKTFHAVCARTRTGRPYNEILPVAIDRTKHPIDEEVEEASYAEESRGT